MYKLEYLPMARQDITDIARYVSNELSNPTAAEQLINEMIESADNTTKFPYANPVYRPIRPLQHEYRRLFVRNYIMFYSVDETKKLITIFRVVYARKNYEGMLK